MTIETLLARAIVCKYHCATWFRGAELTANVLLIKGDAAHVMFVEHMWLEQFRVIIPDLIIRQRPTVPAPPKAEKPTYNTKLWKRAPYGTQPDLLD